MSHSIILAREFDNGVIIGSDSRRTMGEYICNRTANKLKKIDDHIYCSGSGSEANIQFIVDQVIYQLHALKLNTGGGGGVSVTAAASIFRELCYCNRNTINADFLIVGWDSTNHGQVYSISSGGMKREAICAIGSGSLYVQGYVDQCSATNMNKEEAKGFVAKTIKIAMRDHLSGGYIRLIIITRCGVEVNTMFK